MSDEKVVNLEFRWWHLIVAAMVLYAGAILAVYLIIYFEGPIYYFIDREDFKNEFELNDEKN